MIIDECKARIESTDEIKLFVERSLPILIHLQLCESLKSVLYPEKYDLLHKFENEKIEELYKFTHVNRGYRPDVGLLNDRL